MQTIFGLFTNYDAAKAAVDRILSAGVPETEMNAIVDTRLAKTAMSISRKTAAEEGGELEGLDGFLAREEPASLPGGEVYASGTLATTVAQTAANPDNRVPDLGASLSEIGISEEMAATYASGVESGGLLFWVRVDDEQASEVQKILREMAAMGVQSHGG